MNASSANPLYFLYGPDEDGCFDDRHEYCACIPYDDVQAEQPYCLNFDKLTCLPLSKTPECNLNDQYVNQSTCLATLYQSEDTPVQ